jgi:deoxycytidylate deaminase
MKGLELAVALAKMSDHPQHKIGAVITSKKGDIISVGVNKMKTHPMQARFSAMTNDPMKIYLHAEIAAIIAAKGVQGHSIYIARIRRNGSTGIAKPCAGCAAALQEYGIKKIYFTTSQENQHGSISV